ncbi:MAG: ergothioneine biosynthesis protein EgtB [Fidelibacterota bacterium]
MQSAPPLRQEISLAAHRMSSQYLKVRRFTEELCTPLAAEDYVIQSMPDVSPTKWHLAHTSWFFETNILIPFDAGYPSPSPLYNYLFNSYYVSAGKRHCRAKRGLLSRPTVREIYDYRAQVDDHMLKLLDRLDESDAQEVFPVVELGLHHEQQHQELILTDIKHVFSINPLRPAYVREEPKNSNGVELPDLTWIAYPEGIFVVGHRGKGFAYDNESPSHRVFVEPFQLASRLVSNGEYLAFIEDGGYERQLLWLSDGWNVSQSQGWKAPLYWERRDGRWWIMTASGMRELSEAEPVCHLSYYEADAVARWAGARLPTEEQWEIASGHLPIEGNFVESKNFHPVPLTEAGSTRKPRQMFGDVWEWTRSHYSPYPGFKPAAGVLGEYNGKFMCNQFVLRGGSCVTSRSHVRRSYRNFFPADARWQFSGIRLAKDGEE